MSSEKKREWFFWCLLVFQYLFSSWLMIGSGALEGIFMKFDNAGIEGNILILILYIFAVFSNGLCVFIFGNPEIINFSRKKKGEPGLKNILMSHLLPWRTGFEAFLFCFIGAPVNVLALYPRGFG